jgi:hypothetical protein
MSFQARNPERGQLYISISYILVDAKLAAVCGMCLIAACIKCCILPRETRLCINLFESTPFKKTRGSMKWHYYIIGR